MRGDRTSIISRNVLDCRSSASVDSVIRFLDGVGSGVGLAKSLLYDVLEHFHSRFPATIAETWVDDLGVTRGGTVRMLKLHFPPAVAGLCADLNERGLRADTNPRGSAGDTLLE